ncbi:PEP-CTERM sorting domain-containing protein [Methylobacillus caricis]|uniref:PEP-CTERM sorting domain-containing protein n=1 Tax=Methylobacillus caricis TaxID=1971611 RepID=UPI001CFFD7C6|nr:PEP-CTERM sorting domain-containing protein [Methylobacillus caricis]MCB5188726.1 PEP-CTERM sorting domain-containing protein [Methylobacillus caricis]
MNIKMKALVAAAVAVMSVSGAANAALDSSVSGVGNNSSLVLTLFDRANNVSATFDLGFNYQTFAVGGVESSSSFSWNLASGDYADAWNSFLSIADVSSIKWGVAAGDHLGAVNQLGSKGFITTYNTSLSSAPTTNFVYSQFQSPLTGLADYINANNELGNHSSVENGASVATSGKAYAGNFYGGDKFYNLGPVALDFLGTEQGVVQYLTSNSVISRGDVLVYDATFSLEADGVLRYTVAAVPEPETYALLLAGLALVGAAARRRKSA